MTTQENPNGGTVVIPAGAHESPVYLRNFGNLLLLVDASGKQLAGQETIEVAPFAIDSVQKVTVTLCHQGFWHEGLTKSDRDADRWHASIKDGLVEALAPGRANLQGMMLRLEATTAQLREELKGEPVTTVQGDAIIGNACAALSALDSTSYELESAIASTVGLLDDNVNKHPQCCEVAGEMLIGHLEGLLGAQLKRVS